MFHRHHKSSDAREYREAAREAWLKADGSFASAETAFRADPRIAKLDPATILLLIKLAFQLWEWWKDRKISDPSVVACSDELSFSGDDE